jgi:hypothetical protein
MISLADVPNGYDEIVRLYGNPDKNNDGILDPDWYKENIKVFTLPYCVRLSWNTAMCVNRFAAHKLVGDAIVDAMTEIWDEIGVEKLQDMDWDMWGGCYNFRPNTNYPTHLSVHSWGAAVDINPLLCPRGVQHCNQPEPILEAFSKRGFQWVPGDWMHAQAAKGY